MPVRVTFSEVGSRELRTPRARVVARSRRSLTRTVPLLLKAIALDGSCNTRIEH